MSETKQGATKRKGRRRRDDEPLPPALALEMLQSAARECQRAGLSLTCESESDELRLTVKGVSAETTPEGSRFVLVGMVQFGNVARINMVQV
jgi:hypothetical protein